MKHYNIPRELFYKLKKYLDGFIFYRNSKIEEGKIKIKTSSSYAKKILDKYTN